MPTQSDLPSIRVLHGVITAGLAVILAVFLLLTYGLHQAPVLFPGNPSPVIAYLLLAASLTVLSTALLVFKARVPARRSGQSVEEFWGMEARGSALLFWVLLEGGGIVGAVGFLITGSLIPAIGAVGAIYLFLTNGPGYFEEAGSR